MSQVIIYTENNQVKVVHPAPEALQTLTIQDIADKVVPSGVSHRITDKSNIPSDREFRDDWTDANPGDTVDVDLAKAKVTQMDRIRAARDAKWSEFDQRYIAAERNGDDLSALNTERQTLRDIPNNAQTNVDAANDVNALKAAWPNDL